MANNIVLSHYLSRVIYADRLVRFRLLPNYGIIYGAII